MPKDHICPNCGTAFRGRKNRVYCSAECKIEVNNNRGLALRQTAKLHFSQMEKNLRILSSYMKDKPVAKVSVLKEKLIAQGFECSGPFIISHDSDGKIQFELGDFILKELSSSFIVLRNSSYKSA